MEEKKYFVSGKIIDPVNKKTRDGKVFVNNGRIERIESSGKKYDHYILPGFVDSHVHIESSMLTPGEFARIAVKHGTVATVSDPHEIANVCGEKGINFMKKDGDKVPLKFNFGVPSCVPATNFETSGAEINTDKVEKLLQGKDFVGLSEMMNFPGVINDDADVWKKINVSLKCEKPIDGHAPGVTGNDLKKYASAGITTDHESSSVEEAVEKINAGIKTQIREGSAAKNFDSLLNLIDKYPKMVMLCTDDCHPDDLLKGHMNKLVKKGLEKGVDIYNLLAASSVNPVKHYNLNVGLLQPGDPADFIVIDDIRKMNILATYIDGRKVYNGKKTLFDYTGSTPVNNFHRARISENDLKVKADGAKIRTIKCFDGKLFTGAVVTKPKILNGSVVSDIDRDIVKIVVLDRYKNSKPAIGFISGLGIKKGSIAQSIAHDSHNIIAAGTNDKDLAETINSVISIKGGIAVKDNVKTEKFQLETAGLISSLSGEKTAFMYRKLNEKVKSLGSAFYSPLMTLSFMALPVIPELKLTDKGLFDVRIFSPVSLFVE